MLRQTAAKLGLLAILTTISSGASAQTVKARWLNLFTAPGDRWHMTLNQEEQTQIRTYRKEWQDWGGMGLAFDVPARGTVPLYRFVQPQSGDHFFTINHEEGLNAIKYLGYQDEGICCYVSPTAIAGTTPIFRLNKGSQHRYVFATYMRDKAVFDEGWKLEGIEGYAWLPLPPCPYEPTLPLQ